MSVSVRRYEIAEKIIGEIIRTFRANIPQKGVLALYYNAKRDSVYATNVFEIPSYEPNRTCYVGRLDCDKRTYNYGGLGGYAAMELAASDVLMREAAA